MEKAAVQAKVLEIFRLFYDGGAKDTVSKILKTDPNAYDLDPGPFYETLAEVFEIDFDDDEGDFGGMGGTVAQTIDFISSQVFGNA